MSIYELEDLCLSEITLVNTFIASKAQYPMKNRGRKHFGMLYTVKGSETFQFRDRTITAIPGSVLFIPKDEQYTIELASDESIVTDIDFELAGEVSFRPFLVKLEKDNEIKNLFWDAEKEWKRKKSGFAAACKGVYYKILSLLIRKENYYLNTDGYERIADSVDYLHQHYLEPEFRLSALAERSNMSQRYFETLFFRKFKTTPKEYVLSMKLSFAKELLSNEKTSVTNVAIFLGYSDIYYFSKLFKAKTGFSPSEYRKAAKKEN